ncbi:hypothetical protein F5Y19DRAFT_442646 [Xylariaceae sp. FL1651]|nr:hypothetical protein F5Y19DRAFT_442646 [Xylariaceae sp. FL1651]
MTRWRSVRATHLGMILAHYYHFFISPVAPQIPLPNRDLHSLLSQPRSRNRGPSVCTICITKEWPEDRQAQLLMGCFIFGTSTLIASPLAHSADRMRTRVRTGLSLLVVRLIVQSRFFQ